MSANVQQLEPAVLEWTDLVGCAEVAVLDEDPVVVDWYGASEYAR